MIRQFKCTPVKELFINDGFKIYGCLIDKNKYKWAEVNKYGTITIKGKFQKLDLDIEYDVTAEESESKYGVCYDVKHIRRPKIMNITDSKNFLKTVTSEERADALLDKYPDIIQKIVNNNTSDIDLSDVKGVKQKTFDNIIKKVNENYKYADIIEKFNGVFTQNMIINLGEVYASSEKIEEELTYRPYDALCKVNRVGFRSADLLLDKLENDSHDSILKGETPRIEFKESLKTSYQRLYSCVNYIISQKEFEGNTYVKARNLIEEVKKLVPEACTQENMLRLQDDKDFKFIREIGGIARSKTYETESNISNIITKAMNTNNNWDIDCNDYKKMGDIELSDDQFSLLPILCKNNIVILNGYAGAGKSQTIRSVVDMCDKNKKSYCLLSTTGKAAKVLRDFTNRNASTIHKELGLLPNGSKKDHEKLLNYDLIVVDEFGMCDIYLFLSLISSISFDKSKVLLVGDSAQLPSVGAGNLLNDLLSLESIPTVTLSKIFRYNSNGLLQVATDSRNGKKYINNDEIMSNSKIFFRGDDKDYVLLNYSKAQIIDQVKLIYKELIKHHNILDISVLSAYNKGEFGTIEINKQLQKIANNNAMTDGVHVTSQETDYYENDLIIQKKNNYKAKLYNGNNNNYDDDEQEENVTTVVNGDVGIIKSIIYNNNIPYIIIDFDGEMVEYTLSDMNNVRLGYSISIHSSQGSSIKIPILVTPSAHTFMLNSNLLYVGFTRAKYRCYHITDKLTTINSCVRKKADMSRNTLLGYLLKN